MGQGLEGDGNALGLEALRGPQGAVTLQSIQGAKDHASPEEETGTNPCYLTSLKLGLEPRPPGPRVNSRP